MSIHFNSTQSSYISNSIPTGDPPKVSSFGISETPSSIISLINQPEGGFSSWIANIFNQICRLFCCSSASDSEVRPLTPLENRIAEGVRILDNHFQSDYVLNANSPGSAIVVVMKYNGNYRVSVNTARIQRNAGREANKAMLRELLNAESQISDGRLEIETMHFEKQNNNTFNLAYVDKSIKFADGNRMAGGGSHPSIHQATVYRQLERAIPSEGERRRVFEFLNQL